MLEVSDRRIVAEFEAGDGETSRPEVGEKSFAGGRDEARAEQVLVSAVAGAGRISGPSSWCSASRTASRRGSPASASETSGAVSRISVTRRSQRATRHQGSVRSAVGRGRHAGSLRQAQSRGRWRRAVRKHQPPPAGPPPVNDLQLRQCEPALPHGLRRDTHSSCVCRPVSGRYRAVKVPHAPTPASNPGHASWRQSHPSRQSRAVRSRRIRRSVAPMASCAWATPSKVKCLSASCMSAVPIPGRHASGRTLIAATSATPSSASRSRLGPVEAHPRSAAPTDAPSTPARACLQGTRRRSVPGRPASTRLHELPQAPRHPRVQRLGSVTPSHAREFGDASFARKPRFEVSAGSVAHAECKVPDREQWRQRKIRCPQGRGGSNPPAVLREALKKGGFSFGPRF